MGCHGLSEKVEKTKISGGVQHGFPMVRSPFLSFLFAFPCFLSHLADLQVSLQDFFLWRF